jgi:hypothetical protein
MYGRGGGLLPSEVSGAAGVTGAVTTVAGIAVLPETGGSIALMVLSGVTILAGTLVALSFIYTRIVMFRNR